MPIPSSDKVPGQSGHVDDHNSLHTEVSTLRAEVTALNDSAGVPPHQHAIGDVTGLQAELDAAASPPFTISQITGLQSALDGKVSGAALPVEYRSRKSADQNTSITTFTDITDIALPVGANQEWDWEIVLLYTASQIADIKLAFTGPTGSSLTGIIQSLGAGATAPASGHKTEALTAYEPANYWVGGLNADVAAAQLRGTIVTTGTSGTLRLRFAQQTQDATTPAVIKAGTILQSRRIV